MMPSAKKTAPARQAIIAGNWKMNSTIAEANSLVKDLAKRVKAQADRAVVVCPPATCLAAVAAALKNKPVAVGSQNIHWEEAGAYTGEISPLMLKEIGTAYAIIGHSERRQYFGETDAAVARRAKAAIVSGIIPIICVGESLESREKKSYKTVITNQVKKSLTGLKAKEVAGSVIAYEPVWAIGTGKTATFEQAEEVCAHIRAIIERLFDKKTAQAIRILYGGSVKPATIDGLMKKPNVDGALVGGASLKAEEFASIANYKK